MADPNGQTLLAFSSRVPNSKGGGGHDSMLRPNTSQNMALNGLQSTAKRKLQPQLSTQQTKKLCSVLEKLKNDPLLGHCSGGFQFFVTNLEGDNIVDSILNIVSIEFALDEDLISHRRFFQALRQFYNRLHSVVKFRMEMKARTIMRNTFVPHTVADEEEPLFREEVPSDDFVHRISQMAPVMPPSEYGFFDEKSAQLKKALRETDPCCPLCAVTSVKPVPMKDPNHLISCHPTVYLYGCHECCMVFPEKTLLATHECPKFANFHLINFVMAQKELEMECSKVCLVCADCGAYMPWKPNGNVDHKTRMQQFIRQHNAERIVPLVVYFAVTDVKSVTEVTFQYFPSHLREVQMSCSRCRIACFSSPLESESHFSDRLIHPERDLHRCKNCDGIFALESLYKDHLLSCTAHTEPLDFGGDPLLADWITTTASLISPRGRQCGVRGGKVYGGVPEPRDEAQTNFVSEFESLAPTRILKKAVRFAREGALLEEIPEMASLPTERTTSSSARRVARALDISAIGPEFVLDLTAFGVDDKDVNLNDIQKVCVDPYYESQLINCLKDHWERTICISLEDGVHTVHVPGSDPIYLCNRCHCFVQSDNGLIAHLNECAPRDDGVGHDLDDRTMSFPVRIPSSLPNPAFFCPECVHSVCSLDSLRKHLAIDHKQWTGPLIGTDAAPDVRPGRVGDRTDEMLGLDTLGRLPKIDETALAALQRTTDMILMDTSQPSVICLDDIQRSTSVGNQNGVSGEVVLLSGEVDNGGGPARIVDHRAQMEKSKAATALWRSSRDEEDGDGMTTVQGSTSNVTVRGGGDKKKWKVFKTQVACSICDGIFNNNCERTLHNHHRKHREAELRKCYLCPAPKLLPNLTDYLEHLREDHMKETIDRNCAKMFRCEFCADRVSSHRLPRHLLFECPDVPLCPWCGVHVHGGHAGLREHRMEHHAMMTQFLCTHCNFRSPSIRDCRDHGFCQSQTQSLLKMNRCECGSPDIYDNINDFVAHYKDIHVTGSGLCAFCGAIASDNHSLKHRIERKYQKKGDVRRIIVLNEELLKHEVFLDKADWITLHEFDEYNTFDQIFYPYAPPASSISRPSTQSHSGRRALSPYPSSSSLTDRPPPSVICLDDDVDMDQDHSYASVGHRDREAMPPPSVYPPDSVICLSDFGNKQMADPEEPREADLAQQQPSVICIEPASQLAASIREEAAEKSPQINVNHVPYVEDEDDDDDIMVIDPPTEAPQSQIVFKENPVVVRKVNEGDDELMVEEIVQHSSGVTSSNIQSRREKTFKCGSCSEKFLTQRSLTEHEKGHMANAGSTTCDGVYGLPLCKEPFFVCLLCSIAYTEQDTYNAHMKSHEKNPHVVCVQCSCVSFNMRTADAHTHYHNEQRAKGGIDFLCIPCKKSFITDTDLMQHAAYQHGARLVFFCKKCGQGSYDLGGIYGHVLGCPVQVHSDTPTRSRDEMLGVVSANLLHYQPKDEEQWKAKQLSDSAVPCVEPCDCAHRSCLTVVCPVLLCTRMDCRGWINANSYLGLHEDDRAIVESMMSLSNRERLSKSLIQLAHEEHQRRLKGSPARTFSQITGLAESPLHSLALMDVNPTLSHAPLVVGSSSTAQNLAAALQRVVQQQPGAGGGQPGQVRGSSPPRRNMNIAPAPGPGLRGPNGARILPANASPPQLVHLTPVAPPYPTPGGPIPRAYQVVPGQAPVPVSHQQMQMMQQMNPQQLQMYMQQQQHRQLQQRQLEQQQQQQQQQRGPINQMQAIVQRTDIPPRNRAQTPLEMMVGRVELPKMMNRHRCVLCGIHGDHTNLIALTPDQKFAYKEGMRQIINNYTKNPRMGEWYQQKIGQKYELMYAECSSVCTFHFDAHQIRANTEHLARESRKCIVCGQRSMVHDDTCGTHVPNRDNGRARDAFLARLYDGLTYDEAVVIAYNILFSPFESICNSHFELLANGKYDYSMPRRGGGLLTPGVPVPSGGRVDTSWLVHDKGKGLWITIPPPRVPGSLATRLAGPPFHGQHRMGHPPQPQQQQGIIMATPPVQRPPASVLRVSSGSSVAASVVPTSVPTQVDYRTPVSATRMVSPAAPPVFLVSRPGVPSASACNTVPTTTLPTSTVPPTSSVSHALQSMGKRNQNMTCKHCPALLTTECKLAFHRMIHESTHKFFCLDCNKSHFSEEEMVAHVAKEHVKNPKIKWDMKCPVDGCGKTGLTTSFGVKKHMKEHGAVFPFTSVCGAHFSDKALMDKHDHHHEIKEAEDCCLVCGLVNPWKKHDLNIEHLMIHAIPRFLRCGVCGIGIGGSNPEAELNAHYRAEHLHPVRPDGSQECKSCKITIGRGDLITHLKAYHTVFAFSGKDISSPTYPETFVVRTGRIFCDTVGVRWKETGAGSGKLFDPPF